MDTITITLTSCAALPEAGDSSQRGFEISYRECRILSLLPSFTIEGYERESDSQEVLRWYLEDFVTLDPFATTKARRVSTSLDLYATLLLEALQIDTIFLVQHHRAPCHLLIRVSSSDSDSSAFRNAKWEVLEKIHNKTDAQWLSGVSVVRVVAQSVEAPTVSKHLVSADRLDVVAITSRPKFDRDIPHRLITRPIFELIQRLNECDGNDTVFRIVRPGTLDALKQDLKIKQEKGGYFNIVHLDVHGFVNEDG
jgi:hypothetical protein